jgi:hypothetical protein
MRPRTRTNIVVFATSITAILAFLNLRGNFSLLSRLPENKLHHVEAARLEAELIPFTAREHRLERKPRLEASETKSGKIAGQWHSIVLVPREPWMTFPGNATGGKADALLGKPSSRAEGSKMQQMGAASLNSTLDDKYHIIASVDGGLYTEW